MKRGRNSSGRRKREIFHGREIKTLKMEKERKKRKNGGRITIRKSSVDNIEEGQPLR